MTDTLEARIGRLEDLEEIRVLLIAYGRSLDQHDLVAYSQLFARDGEWHGGLGSAKTPAGILAMLEKAFSNMTPGLYRTPHHIMSNFDITLDGDSATAHSRWEWIVGDGEGAPTVMRAGHYDDELVREDKRWRFQRRRAVTELQGQPK